MNSNLRRTFRPLNTLLLLARPPHRVRRLEQELASADDLFKFQGNPSFEVGIEHLPAEFFSELVSKNPTEDLHRLKKCVGTLLTDSDAFYADPGEPARVDWNESSGKVVFASSDSSPWDENRRVHGHYLHAARSKKAVVLLGHWNSPAATYNKLATVYRRAGISTFRVSLPYHDERKPEGHAIASAILSPNLGLTLRSMRQAVRDVRAVVSWLESRGYSRIGILGSSLGSGVALITANLDPRLERAVGYLAAGDFGRLVWSSQATRHIQRALAPHISEAELCQIWALLGPSTFLDRLRLRQSVHHFLVRAELDEIVLPSLALEFSQAYRTRGIQLTELELPCGHNTLGITPFRQVAGLRGLSFFRSW